MPSQEICVPYQVDFESFASGKHVAVTKRHVKWRFGFANVEALVAGEKGVDCRGREFEVELVWSFASGKCQILFNGTEVHYAVSGHKNQFEHTFDMPGVPGYRSLQILGFARTPFGAVKATQGKFHQFDLKLDGESFFRFPEIYELGETNASSMKKHKVTLARLRASSPPPCPNILGVPLNDGDSAALLDEREAPKKNVEHRTTPQVLSSIHTTTGGRSMPQGHNSRDTKCSFFQARQATNSSSLPERSMEQCPPSLINEQTKEEGSVSGVVESNSSATVDLAFDDASEEVASQSFRDKYNKLAQQFLTCGNDNSKVELPSPTPPVCDWSVREMMQRQHMSEQQAFLMQSAPPACRYRGFQA